MSFKFLEYNYDETSRVATFSYQGKDGIIFQEQAEFGAQDLTKCNKKALDEALFFAFIVVGTSYYKAEPTREIELEREIDCRQAEIFSTIYQEGLSQFAFENGLKRTDLAQFRGEGLKLKSQFTGAEDARLVLVSGGKDSLLLAEKIRQEGLKYRTVYVSSRADCPEIIRAFGEPLIIKRKIDGENLKRAGGLNGHVPITLIIEALAAVQAILLGYRDIELGIGQEGIEPHAFIDDLPVNHQWSKTKEAQDLLREYVRDYIAEDLTFGNLLERYKEIEIADQFAEFCWDQFGQDFSSCNVANYKQGSENRGLKWCGKCPKCLNSYLLFAPFVEFKEQEAIFGRDLFTDPKNVETFKGLLGVDGVMKPFECIASIDELRRAYETRLPGYGDLPFKVPAAKEQYNRGDYRR